MIDRHIFLIGMPGSGKSSLGKRLARRVQMPYIDTDARICEFAGCATVAEIFEKYGEAAFRNGETNLMMRLMDEQPSIVSTGGGMVINPVNREIMRNQGYVVLIDRPLPDILSDIKLDRRPLLAAKGKDEVVRLYEERIQLYRDTADAMLRNGAGYINGIYNLEKIVCDLYGIPPLP